MSFQKCPVCEGTGKISFLNYTCPTCNGQRIISEVNGLPPATAKPQQDRFCDIARFVMKARFDDPLVTLEEIEKQWLNK